MNIRITYFLFLLVSYLCTFTLLRTLLGFFFYWEIIEKIVSLSYVIFAIYIMYRRDLNAQFKGFLLLWMLLFPFGCILGYCLFREKRQKRPRKQLPRGLDDPYYQTLAGANVVYYLQEYLGYRAYHNTRVVFLNNLQKWEKMLEILGQAQKFIFLEYYIIAEGKAFDTVVEILAEKVQNGVEVVLICDDFGAFQMGDHQLAFQRLRAIGVQTYVFNPIHFWNFHSHTRSHRKLILVDGKWAITGGMNLADEYFHFIQRFGYWKDCAVFLEGEGVKTLLEGFLTLYQKLASHVVEREKYSVVASDFVTDGYVQPFFDNPQEDENVGESVHVEMINTARKSIYLQTPYFIPSEVVEHSLRLALRRGVLVTLIIPYIPDKKAIYELTKYYAGRLMSEGARVYFYQPGFLHSKVVLVDRHLALVSTINLDFRSFYLNHECGVFYTGVQNCFGVDQDCQSVLQESVLATEEQLVRVSWLRHLYRALLNLFAPLL